MKLIAKTQRGTEFLHSYKCQYKKCHILSNKYAQQLSKFYGALTLKLCTFI